MRGYQHERGWLFLGTARDARDSATPYESGVTTIVDLAIEESPAGLPRDLIVLRSRSPTMVRLIRKSCEGLCRALSSCFVRERRHWCVAVRG